MPRRQSLTSDSARRQRRRISVGADRIIINNNLIDESSSVELQESYKCALNMPPRNFNSYTLGNMTLRCSFCSAKHFQLEITGRESDAFSLCCHKGKVMLPALTPNNYFEKLLKDVNSTNVANKKRAQNYLANIRSYNASFAMVSSEAQLDENVLNGVYHFKIHNVFYHRIGAVQNLPNRVPCYAQLYFYDVETALQYRMSERSNVRCDLGIMRSLAEELYRVNPFIRSFKTMSEYCQQPENSAAEVSMVIRVNQDLDMRRYNDTIQTDVATIFKSVDGEPPFERNMITFSKNSNSVHSVSVLDSSLDPLAYPLLFPNGETGWHVNLKHSITSTSASTAPRNKITMLQYASFRLAIRDEFSILHSSQKLFLQWIVDIYVRIEGSRLHFIRQNQASLRADVYNNLTDFLQQHPNDSVNSVGHRIVLPSSFIGSPRNMYQNYLDAMAIVQHYGKPSLFITMTCNPNWPEISNNISPGDSPNFQPHIVVRVFRSKLKKLIECLEKSKIFGKVKALIYTIEFQKRGLPHAHILLTLDSTDKINDIDKFVSAEIPDISVNPKLHNLVKKHMIHGPCGLLNPNSVCMRDGKCSKNFPKDFCNATQANVKGYPVYMRRDNGISVDVRGHSVDNRYVVPYNPYLLAKFDCHLNVEVCSTVNSIKYIYKYVYKGYDCASLQFGRVSDGDHGEVHIDEIDSFLSGRYVGSTEANWRINEYPMHYQSHNIVRLECHLPQRQNVVFREGNVQQALQNHRRTKLTAFFEINQIDSSDLLYTETPIHYIWVDKEKKWKKRQRGGSKAIARLFYVSPKDVELFHLRLLLLHVRGPICFQDLRTVGNIVYPTFSAAAHARGIASNDREWRECLLEAKECKSPQQLRELFAIICGMNVPTNALDLWNEFKNFMCEDFLRNFSENDSYNRGLLVIEEILFTHNLSCEQLGLPIPQSLSAIVTAVNPDPEREEAIFDEMFQSANAEQRSAIDLVLQEVLNSNTGCNIFCLTAHAGCGKTFVQTAIIHKLNSLNLQCIACAFSGIASTLLIQGRTLHNVFKLPIPILENSVSSLSVNSAQAQFIKSASIIIIDEISMCPLNALKLIDRFLNDLCGTQTKLFGGKTILLCGDFRQTLPVVPHGTRVSLIENCLTSWSEFSKFHKISLTQNMRALPHEIEFVEFLKSLGNATIPTFPDFGQDVIEIPSHLVSSNSVIADTYGNVSETIQSNDILNSVILAPKYQDCTFINAEILSSLSGEERIYLSSDKILSDDYREQNNFPVEFLNSVDVSGLPPHKLILKPNCILLLIRNLNTRHGLVNGTRMRLVQMHNNCLDCEILTGVARNTRILIPRIHLNYSGTLLPFSFQRTQFPVILAFAMTINKSQGQTFQKVGILLRQPVFSHGQLYVAASRVRSFEGLRFYISETPEQGHLAGDDRIFTKNIVYEEVLRSF